MPFGGYLGTHTSPYDIKIKKHPNPQITDTQTHKRAIQPHGCTAQQT